MPESLFTWIVVCAYAALMVAAGALSKRASSFRVFAIGGRSNHPVLIGMAVAVGAVSSTTFVINPGLVWLYGYSAFLAIALSSRLGFLSGQHRPGHCVDVRSALQDGAHRRALRLDRGSPEGRLPGR